MINVDFYARIIYVYACFSTSALGIMRCLTRLTYANWFCSAWPDYAVIDQLIGLVINAPCNVTWCKKFALPFIFLNPKTYARMVKFPVKFSHCRVYLVFQTGDISVSVCGVCFNQISLSFLCRFQSTFNAPTEGFCSPPIFKNSLFPFPCRLLVVPTWYCGLHQNLFDDGHDDCVRQTRAKCTRMSAWD